MAKGKSYQIEKERCQNKPVTVVLENSVAITSECSFDKWKIDI